MFVYFFHKGRNSDSGAIEIKHINKIAHHSDIEFKMSMLINDTPVSSDYLKVVDF
jgi:hypothetical protein